MNRLLAEIIGWYGAAAIVLAYVLVSFGFVNADNLFYQVLNFTGAIGIIVIALLKKTYQPAAVNVVWAAVAVFAILRILF